MCCLCCFVVCGFASSRFRLQFSPIISSTVPLVCTTTLSVPINVMLKKWKTSTNNIQTNRNPLLLIKELLFLPIAQFSTLLNWCSNSQHHHGDHDLKGGVVLQFKAFSTKTSAKRPEYWTSTPYLFISLSYLSFHSLIPYRSTSFWTLMLLIAYPEARCTDSLSFFPCYLSPYFYLPTCKITTSYLSH